MIVGAVVLVMIAGIVGVVAFVSNDDSSDTPPASDQAVEPEAPTEDFALVLGSGEPAIEVYVDFRCPACESFEETHGDTLFDAADNGAATVKVRPLGLLDDQPTTDYSTRAAAASVCAADAEAFHEYSQALFFNQPTEGGAGHDDSTLAGFGEDLGLDARFSDCVAEGAYVDWVNEGTELARSEGVPSVSHVLIDAKQIDPAEADNALDDALNG